MNDLVKIEFEEIEEMSEENDLESSEIKERFKIKNLDAANWAFKKLSAIEIKEEENRKLVVKERERLDAWLEAENKRTESEKSFFESLLMEYQHEGELQDEKFKVSTPYGKIIKRTTKKWDYGDEKALVEIFKNGKFEHLIRTKEELNKTEIKKEFSLDKDTKKLVSKDGEIMEEIKVTDEVTYTIKVGE